jgi:capsular polysaccharide transport system permease protein
LTGLLGSTSQSGDSYIVSSYVESLQLVRDVKSELGIDLRQYYSRDNIDFMYRIKPDMPLEQFTEYWRDMINVSYNSTTGNTTLFLYGFSADDTKAIADAVLKVSERLVNELSENSRRQLTAVASKQVERAEQRMREVRESMRKLRVDEKALDPAQMAGLQNTITSNIQQQITDLKTKLTVLLQSVSKDAPSARVMRRQIDALEAQLKLQENKLGPKNKAADKSSRVSSTVDTDTNLAEALNKFEELTVEQGFATQAYTTALAAFETSLAEAQKQERYFATFVAPTRPEIALYPLRWMDSFIAFLVLAAFWMISQFLFRSFRDHAI